MGSHRVTADIWKLNEGVTRKDREKEENEKLSSRTGPLKLSKESYKRVKKDWKT